MTEAKDTPPMGIIGETILFHVWRKRNRKWTHPDVHELRDNGRWIRIWPYLKAVGLHSNKWTPKMSVLLAEEAVTLTRGLYKVKKRAPCIICGKDNHLADHCPIFGTLVLDQKDYQAKIDAYFDELKQKGQCYV